MSKITAEIIKNSTISAEIQAEAKIESSITKEAEIKSEITKSKTIEASISKQAEITANLTLAGITKIQQANDIEGTPEDGNTLVWSDDTGKFTYSSPAGEDKNYTEEFTDALDIDITHNLNKFPSVTIVDTAGDEVVTLVRHLDRNTINLTFTAETSGKVYIN